VGIYAMTGGATGIGAAIKNQLRDEGHNVTVVDIKDADIIADLSTVEGRQTAVDGICAAAPEGLDGFIACAGLGPNVTPPSLVTRVNYFGAVATVEGVKNHVARKKGVIIIISSNSAPMPGTNKDYVNLCLNGKEDEACALVDTLDGQNAYGGSKLAITRWMRRNTVAYAAEGVRMNAVAPGIIQTPLSDKVMADPNFAQAMKEFANSVPTGSIGQPEQVAAAVCFLLRPEAGFICGSVLFVDGGHDAMLRPDQF
jgi:NAD(P)-dependent dehydrogenase (short-subunit alcohol dehydrogenase family)